MTEPIAHPTFLREVANLSFWIVGWVVVIALIITATAFVVAVACSLIDKIRKGYFE